MIVTLNAWNRLVAHLCESGTGLNMNPLSRAEFYLDREDAQYAPPMAPIARVIGCQARFGPHYDKTDSREVACFSRA